MEGEKGFIVSVSDDDFHLLFVFLCFQAVEVDDVFLNQHPLSGLDGAGIMLQRLRKQFHSFLRTTSNIMPKVCELTSIYGSVILPV